VNTRAYRFWQLFSQVAMQGFFLFFLYASARIVTCGNDGGCCNGGDADAFHGCCVLCNYYLSVLYPYIG
jgi:hypothetical protein